MKKKIITEAVRYGNREKNSVLNSLDDYGFGIEIELVRPKPFQEESHLGPSDFYPSNFVHNLARHTEILEDEEILERMYGVFFSKLEVKSGKSILYPAVRNVLLKIADHFSDTHLDAFEYELYYDSYNALMSFYTDNNFNIDEEIDFSYDVAKEGITPYPMFCINKANLNSRDDTQSFTSNVINLYSLYYNFLKDCPHSSDLDIPFTELSTENKETLKEFFW